MPMPRTDNPYRDFLRHEDEAEEWLEKRPVCEICDHHIQDEGGFLFEDKWYHNKCFHDEYWKWLD